MKIQVYNVGLKKREYIEVPVIGTNNSTGKDLPVIGLKMMDADMEKRIYEEQKRKHPEIYAELEAAQNAG